MRITAMPILAMIAVAIAGPARAEDNGCAGVTATDACLVGVWRMESGGPAEWLRKNMPQGMALPQFAAEGTAMMRYRSDGAYKGARVGIEEGKENQPFRFESGSLTASGRWATDGERLLLCSDGTGTAPSLMVGGRKIPVPQSSAGKPQSFGYRCDGDTLETTRRFPGMAEPMITRYSRVD